MQRFKLQKGKKNPSFRYIGWRFISKISVLHTKFAAFLKLFTATCAWTPSSINGLTCFRNSLARRVTVVVPSPTYRLIAQINFTAFQLTSEFSKLFEEIFFLRWTHYPLHFLTSLVSPIINPKCSQGFISALAVLLYLIF